jgi:hypothetical protein
MLLFNFGYLAYRFIAFSNFDKYKKTLLTSVIKTVKKPNGAGFFFCFECIILTKRKN